MDEHPLWEFESREVGLTQSFWSAPVRRLRAEADINLPTIPDESVENDRKATVAMQAADQVGKEDQLL